MADDDNDGTQWTAGETEGTAIHVGNDVLPVEGQITADKVKEVARSHGIRNFNVEDADGNELGATDFPRNGHVYISQYDVPK